MKLTTKLFIIIDVIVVLCFFFVYGPIDYAKKFWITTAMETANHKYLANIFYSESSIKEVMSNNYLVEVEEETDAEIERKMERFLELQEMVDSFSQNA